MRTTAASWILVGSLAACALGASACELIVGGGDYKTGDGDGGSSSGTAGSGTSSSGTAGSGAPSSGTGSSGTVSSGTSSSGTASSGVSSSGTASSGVSSSGTASSGVSSSGTASSGTSSSGAGADAGGNASAFAGTWQTTTTETFSNCTDSDFDVSQQPAKDSFTWVASGSGLTGSGGTCSYNAMVSGMIAVVSPGSTCMLTSTDEVDQFAFMGSAWELSAGGTTATVFLTGTDTATFSDGGTVTCNFKISGTATRP